MHRAWALVAGLLLAGGGLWWSKGETRQLPDGVTLPHSLPFTLVSDHLMLDADVGGHSGLSFMLDTGNRFAIVDLERATALRVPFGRSINVTGTAGAVQGRYVSDASYALTGFPGFTAPLKFAVPLSHLGPRLGRSLDGLVGSDFIEQFVVEIDYEASVLRLHDPRVFHYTGSGQEIPIVLNAQRHPVLQAALTVNGRTLQGSFVLDLGSGAAVELNAPFVAQHALLDPPMASIRALGFAGAAGNASGRVGRLDQLTLGRFELGRPQAFFSQDAAGANADAALLGRIGTRVAKRFRVFLDYGNRRIILEPNAAYRSEWHDATSGLLIEARGSDYAVFEVREILENSPATDAGFRVGDIVQAIDGHATGNLSLSDIVSRFRVPGTYAVLVRRGNSDVALTLTTRLLF